LIARTMTAIVSRDLRTTKEASRFEHRAITFGIRRYSAYSYSAYCNVSFLETKSVMLNSLFVSSYNYATEKKKINLRGSNL